MSNLIRSSRTTAATRFPGGLADSELGPVLHPFGPVRVCVRARLRRTARVSKRARTDGGGDGGRGELDFVKQALGAERIVRADFHL